MRRALLAAIVAATGLASCNVDPFCLDCVDNDGGGTKKDGALTDGGGPGDAGDAGPDAFMSMDGCVPTGVEVCNGIDDNCNGQIDEGNPGGGQTCSRNVGECHTGTTQCMGGALVCVGGVVPMPETCDGKDNDCDGVVDNGDPGGGPPCGSNVGECKRGALHCVNGAMTCMGAIGPQPEICDGKDNNCDTMIDNGVPAGPACGNATGECRAGMMTCVGGAMTCTGVVGPKPETCDNKDNNCNGMTDETFNKATDVNNCGTCGHVCSGMNAVWQCVPDAVTVGKCKVRFCLSGFFNNNGLDSDGCEYACNFKGQEICNGEDDDCDGVIDNGVAPPPAGFCKGIGECSTNPPANSPPTAVCSATQKKFVCPYGPTVSTDGMGNIVPETKCDGKDNDCNGVIDHDSFPTLGNACGNGQGACRTTGSLVCNTAQTGVSCNAPAALSPGVEVCNGIDDDCDGSVDETKAAPGTNPSYVVEDMTQVSANLYVYKYEASKPGATGASSGTFTNRSCSKAGVLPWTNVTYPQALAACQAAGMTLCTEAQWQQACQGTSTTCAWGMASCASYNATQCNGNDYGNAMTAGNDNILATGSLASCASTWGTVAAPTKIFDMSGNTKEWTLKNAAGNNVLRGGADNSPGDGMRCDFNFTIGSDTFQFNNVGFRCCSATAP